MTKQERITRSINGQVRMMMENKEDPTVAVTHLKQLLLQIVDKVQMDMDLEEVQDLVEDAYLTLVNRYEG